MTLSQENNKLCTANATIEKNFATISHAKVTELLLSILEAQSIHDTATTVRYHFSTATHYRRIIGFVHNRATMRINYTAI